MVLTFTLQSAYSGATYVAGPFDISGTTSGGITTLLGDNISKASLLTGVTISNIDDATTGGTIQSVDGICSNSIQWTVNGGPGPTITPTPSGDGFCFELIMDDMTYQNSTLSVRYTPAGGTSTLTPLQLLEVYSEIGGSVAIFLCSETEPTWWNSSNEQVTPPGYEFTSLGTNCSTNGQCVNGGGQSTPTPTPGPTSTPVPTNTSYFCQQTVNDPCGIYQQPCSELGLIDCTLPQ